MRGISPRPSRERMGMGVCGGGDVSVFVVVVGGGGGVDR